VQHQIPTDDPINTRQYRFPQIHKEEINKQVEELLEGGIVKPSQSLYRVFDNCGDSFHGQLQRTKLKRKVL